jgi:hypothetical protein
MRNQGKALVTVVPDIKCRKFVINVGVEMEWLR